MFSRNESNCLREKLFKREVITSNFASGNQEVISIITQKLYERITKTTDSVCNPIHFRFIAPSQVQPSTYYSGYILRSTRWRTRQSGELIEIMSSKGIDYKRISGLAKLLSDCKTEVKFYATH